VPTAPCKVLEACACGGHAGHMVDSVCASPGPPAAAAIVGVAAAAASAREAALAMWRPPAAVVDRPPPGPTDIGADAADLCQRFEQWEDWDASTMPLWKHAMAGSCAGVMEHIGMYPLDTVKTHMQALKPGARLGVVDVVRSIVQDTGGFGFLRGISAIAAGCIPAHIALFTSYEFSKQRLLSAEGAHEPMKAAFCGACATVCHDVILTPMDVVKQRMQLGAYRNTGDCLRSTLRGEGVRGLYRSVPTTLALNVPFGGVFVASNESLKLSLGLGENSGSNGDSARSASSRSDLPLYFMSAGLSGALAAGVTQPLDVVKTRLQTQDVAVGSVRHSAFPKYSGFVPTVMTIVREEGAATFVRGMLPRMIHAVPSAAMCWGTYEAVKSFLA